MSGSGEPIRTSLAPQRTDRRSVAQPAAKALSLCVPASRPVCLCRVSLEHRTVLGKLQSGNSSRPQIDCNNLTRVQQAVYAT